MNIEKMELGVIKNVIEDASCKRKNDGQAREQASANEAVNNMWVKKVVEDESENEIKPGCVQSLASSV